MRRIWWRPLLGVSAIAAGAVAAIRALPSKFRIERGIAIGAPRETIHRYVGDLRRWLEWTAWTPETDPSLKFNYEGDTSKPGGVARWTSRWGPGMLAVDASDPESGLRYHEEMGGLRNTGSILYSASERGTHVTWVLDIDAGSDLRERYRMWRAQGRFARDFDESLAKLEKLVETPP